MQKNLHPPSKNEKSILLNNYSPHTLISTLLNSIDNYLNNEIRLAAKNNQVSLLFLGIHSVILTISEAFYEKMKPKDSFCRFLKEFVDGPNIDQQFSMIAEEIHYLRNVLAHEWIGYGIDFDFESTLGWYKLGGITIINPQIYFERYISAFSASSKLWDFDELLTEEEMEKAKARIIKKFDSGK